LKIVHAPLFPFMKLFKAYSRINQTTRAPSIGCQITLLAMREGHFATRYLHQISHYLMNNTHSSWRNEVISWICSFVFLDSLLC